MTATTSNAQPLAYRCSRCFQTNCDTTDHVGQSVSCSFCDATNVIPEATEDRIARGLEFLQQASDPFEAGNDFASPSVDITDEEIMRQARMETYANAGPSAMVCSRLKRFLGSLVDGFAFMVTFVGAAILAAVIAPTTGNPDEPNFLAAAIILGLPTMLGLVQMILVATEGRTIGKYVVNTKIVTADGNVPGFFQGVFMRMIVNAFLGVVPFYGLIDAFVIFTNDTNRCVHDFIAGTYVIDAH